MAVSIQLRGVGVGVGVIEGGRQVRLYHEQSDTEWLLDLDSEGAAALASDLSLSDDDLVAKIAGQIAQLNGHGA